MSDPSASLTDAFDRGVGIMLLIGLVFSALCLVVGLALWLGSRGEAWGAVPLTAGLITLMATPVVRVVFALVGYARLRDWPFAAATATVLIVLVASVLYALKIS